MTAPAAIAAAATARRDSLRRRLAERGLDTVTLLVVPAALLVVVTLRLSFPLWPRSIVLRRRRAASSSNYDRFFSDPYMYRTIWLTLRLALPVTVLNLLLSVPIAMKVRHMRHQRILTTILVLPVTLGTVLVAEGLLNYLGPQGWLNRGLVTVGLIDRPIRLTQNYWGVFISLVITGFPLAFLLTLSLISGIDPALEKAAATLGAGARQRFARILLPLIVPGLAVVFCLAFVDAFSVFPSAVLLGAPAGETRVISIAAAQVAFEQYDHSYASAIAMIMTLVQLGFVAVVLAVRGLAYRGPAAGGKG